VSVILPEYADIVSAVERIKGHAVRTPLLRNDGLDQKMDARIFIKAENLQRTGSFKFRGACNRISRLTDDEKRCGIIAYSSGNHAQGVAAAARIFGTSATILMPQDAPAAKVEGVKFWGGRVVFFDRATESREEIAASMSAKDGSILVPPYEDAYIMAGQGTAGVEAVEQMAAHETRPDIIICPAGGGGLIAGVGLAVKHHYPEAQIWAAEPDGFDDHARSFLSGSRQTNERLTGSVCDAIITPTPGEMTWRLNAKQLSGVAVVTDDEALDAMAFAWRHLKTVVEPGGVVALAAVLSGKLDLAGKTVCVLATGGNVDREVFKAGLDRL
jgi:threonine dehydratase